MDHLRCRRGRFAVSTGRSYQNALRLFCDYVTDPRYGWPTRCMEQFGAVPAQILHEWNTVTHSSDYEGDPRRRPLTYDEVQALFEDQLAASPEWAPERYAGIRQYLEGYTSPPPASKGGAAHGVLLRGWVDCPRARHHPG